MPLPAFVVALVALALADDPHLVFQPKEAVRLHLHSEISVEATVGLGATSTATVLDQDATIAPKGDDTATTHLYTVELGSISGKVDIPNLGKVEFGPGKEKKQVDPLLAAFAEVFRRSGGLTVTARISPRGIVEEVTGDEHVLDGLTLPPEIAKTAQIGDGDLRTRVQEFVTRLPEEALKKGFAFQLDVVTEVSGAKIAFRPLCKVGVISKDKAAFEMKTELEAFEKGKIAAKDRDKPLWSSAAKQVKKAAIQIASSVSLTDGLALAQSSTSTYTIELPNPDGGSIPTVNRTKHTLERVIAKK